MIMYCTAAQVQTKVMLYTYQTVGVKLTGVANNSFAYMIMFSSLENNQCTAQEQFKQILS